MILLERVLSRVAILDTNSSRALPQDLIHGQIQRWKVLGDQVLSPYRLREPAVALGRRVSVDLDSFSLQVYDPDFRYALASVMGKLHITVVVYRAVRHFHQQKHVLRTRVSSGVEVGSPSQQCKIRLRLRVASQPDRALHPGSRRCPPPGGKTAL